MASSVAVALFPNAVRLPNKINVISAGHGLLGKGFAHKSDFSSGSVNI